MAINFSSLSNEDNEDKEAVVFAYDTLLTEVANVIGDLGEYLAIDFYNKTSGLPKLQVAPQGNQNVDALSRNGERYSIKTTTGKVTGVFYGLPPKGSGETPEKKFEYVIIVIMNEDFVLSRINELTWDDFLKYKSWDSKMNAWNISINKELLEKTKTIFKK